MGVDEDIVARDIGEAGSDVANASHISGEVVDVIDATRRLQAVGPMPQVEQLEIVSRGWLELWLFDVGAAYPVALQLQSLNQVVADEPSGPGNENTSF